MSKKNLARTAIEGGRYNHNKWDRNHSNRTERASQREFLSRVEQDLDYFDQDNIKPRNVVYKEFKDKLNPMYRWLRSQIGRKWDDVRSEVAQKFDTRTTAGRHITYDHLLSSVEEVPNLKYNSIRYAYKPEDFTESYYPNNYYVDDEGLLQEKTVTRKRYKQKIIKCDTKQLVNWLSGRIVGQVGNSFYWFVPSDKNKKRGGVNRTWAIEWGNTYSYLGPHFMYLGEKKIYKKDSLGKTVFEVGHPIVIGYQKIWYREHPDSFRQSHKLNSQELKYFSNLDKFYKDKILVLSPTYHKPK